MSDQVTKAKKTNVTIKIVATTLMILSGVVLYLDKIFSYLDITLVNLHGWSNQENYIWALSQTISPILIGIAFYLRPFYISCLVPLFCYVLQFYFVLDSTLTLDKPLTWAYVSGTTFIIIVIAILLKKFLDNYRKLDRLRTEVMQSIIKADDELLKEKKN